MKKLHTRRKRRQAKMVERSHGKFKVGHKRLGGRTGSSKPGRTKLRHHARFVVQPEKRRQRIYIFGDWALANKVLDVIAAQEQLERLGALRMTSAPEMDAAERAALERVYAGAIAERDGCYRACSGHERGAFDAWRRSDPTFRESLKAVLTDLPPRKSPERKAWGARPLTGGRDGDS